MKKKFKLVNLDCANCAARMEAAINRIEGVHKATVSFVTQRLTIDAEDERFEEILQQAAEACRKIEPDCLIQMP